jgi:hypothetical protein
MKKLLLFTVIMAILSNSLSGQGNENSIVDNYVKSRLIIKKDKIVSDTLAKVFAGTFYRVNIGFNGGEGESTCSQSIIIIKDGKLIELDNRLDSMKPLLVVVRKDFLLRSDADGKVFETSLKKLFPISEFTEPKDIFRSRNGNTWYFIRGTFMDSKSGYIIKTDKNFRITNIAYEMEAIKKK